MTLSTALVWFRQDLRLEDHPALHFAQERHDVVLPVYIWAPEEAGRWQPGGASRWWLHHSLAQLQQDLSAYDAQLTIQQGNSADTLAALCKDSGAEAVYWNKCYEPWAIARDADVVERLQAQGLRCKSFHTGLLIEPEALLNKQGAPYQVFTPFWKAAQQCPLPRVYPRPQKLPRPKIRPKSLALESLKLLPRVDWAGGLRDTWRPGGVGAAHNLDRFLEAGMADYHALRDFPDEHGTASLSPHLHFGEVTPGLILKALEGLSELENKGCQAFVRQLYWREFAHYMLYHFPHTDTEPLRPAFKAFPWQSDSAALRAWRRGETGYPMVDAGMRELWRTGWMHNRVRMIVASFLVKHLLIPWQEGAAWFWDTLVDADLANNTLGWQWAAGCGADAAPYFRIFNPMTQAGRYDPKGDYIRKWVPELAGLPTEYLYRPWELSDIELQAVGVTLDKDYPRPIVDHLKAREMALAAYAQIKRGNQR